MSQLPQNTSLSRSARLLCYLGPPSTILLTYIASPRTGVLSPLALIPTAFFYTKWRESNSINPSRRGELEPMIWTYAATGTVGLMGAALLQLGIGAAISYLLFGSGPKAKDFMNEFLRSSIDGLTAEELARRAAMAASWQNWVFNVASTFGMAGLVEETLKYLPIAYARRRGTEQQRQRRDRAYIDYALAGALSFGVVENIGFLYAACEKGGQTWPRLLVTVLERVVVGATGHLLVACLTALRAIRRDYYGDQLSWWGVVGPAAVLHGAFNFGAMVFSTLEGNVGWIHPTGVWKTSMMIGLLASLVAATGWQVRREWKGLQSRDRQRK